MENSDNRFTFKDLNDLLQKQFIPSSERIIITGNSRQSLKINKEDWKHYFSGYGGIDFKQGKEIRMISGESGGPKSEIPQWVRDRLGFASGDAHCITEREGKYFFKRLQLTERLTTVPGIYIIDAFDTDTVRRSCSVFTDFEKITRDSLEQMLSLLGTFRHDPLKPFRSMDGRIGSLARKKFRIGFTKNDAETISSYRQHLAESQLGNGSWDENSMTTAFHLIRLIEAGATLEEETVEKGVKWLLTTTEPIGFPGLFMLSEKLIHRFNAWKENQKRGKSGRPHRRTTDNEAKKYLQDRDVLSSVSAVPCELRLTWTSGIAIEALLRCGLHKENRVVRAINTLLAMSEKGGWCGCGYFDTREKNFVPDSSQPIDFNRFPMWRLQPDYRLFANITCDNHYLSGMDIGNRRALLVKRFRSTGECAFVIKRALSFHPEFPRSNFEANVTLSWMGLQSAIGTWGDAYLSTAFGILERITHPLSAFLTLRPIPLLIREQKSDGFWQENRKNACPPPTKEETTFMILRTLKKFHFLDRLLPHA